jgi:hypothetical protein
MDEEPQGTCQKRPEKPAGDLIRLREHLAELQRERTEALTTARAIALAGLPKKRSPRTELSRTLRLGQHLWLRVIYQTAPKGILPYGEDRFVLAGIQSLAVKLRSPLVFFEHVSELLKMFGLSTDGRSLQRLRERFGRLAELAIRLRFAETENGLDDPPAGESIFMIRGFMLPTRKQLKEELLTVPLRRRQLTLPGIDMSEAASRYGVLLSADFWELLKEPKNQLLVPLDLMRLFVNNPTGWDYATFLVYRCSRAKQASVVSHEVLMSLFKDGERERDKTTIKRLLQYHQQVMAATNGHLQAELRPAGYFPIDPQKGGRPKERWELLVGPSLPIVYSGKREELFSSSDACPPEPPP